MWPDLRKGILTHIFRDISIFDDFQTVHMKHADTVASYS